jgi:2-dehydropantoate 2-reductase
MKRRNSSEGRVDSCVPVYRKSLRTADARRQRKRRVRGMMKIAVIGPGAIGGTLAGWLAQSKEHDVIVCARSAFSELVVEAPGGRRLVAAPAVLTDPAAASPVDWILTTTKTYDSDGASRWIEKLLGPLTILAVVQNGVEHLTRFTQVAPLERTLPVIIDIPAERTAPGRILQRRHGEITTPGGDLGRRFCALFDGTDLTPKTTSDFLSASWRKLVLNSASVVSALTLLPARVARHEKAAVLMREIAAESLRVGRAVGATLEDTLPDLVVERQRAADPETVTSLLGDRLAGRRTEIDARNGVIVRLGKEHGIPTPLNAMAVALIEAASESA